MKVLVITNQKGGVGKTTTAVSLGAALVGRGQKVLLIDLDPQGNATSGLGLGKDRPNSIYDVLLHEGSVREAVAVTPVKGLEIIPSSGDMAGAEVELVPMMAREYRLRDALKGAFNYDTVLVDCPPSLGLLTINALAAADAVVIPVQCEYYALEGLAQLLKTIEAVRQRLNERLRILAIVLTMEDRRNRLSMAVTEEVHRHFPEFVANTRIPRAVRLAEAPSHGIPISMYDPGSRAAVAYEELADELIGRLFASTPIAMGAAGASTTGAFATDASTPGTSSAGGAPAAQEGGF